MNVFRRFTRSVFDAQAGLLRHGDAANAQFGHSSARAARCSRRAAVWPSGPDNRRTWWLSS
jgi:hypothetical protein